MSAVITGARAFVKLSGSVVAFASGVSVSHENRLEEIPQLDSLEVAEYAENGHRCTVTISSLRLNSQAEIGGQRINNSAASFSFDHPEGALNQILLQPEIIIEIVDAVPVRDSSGRIVNYEEAAVYVAYGAKFAGGSGELTARGVWQGTWTFKARRGVGI